MTTRGRIALGVGGVLATALLAAPLWLPYLMRIGAAQYGAHCEEVARLLYSEGSVLFPEESYLVPEQKRYEQLFKQGVDIAGNPIVQVKVVYDDQRWRLIEVVCRYSADYADPILTGLHAHDDLPTARPPITGKLNTLGLPPLPARNRVLIYISGLISSMVPFGGASAADSLFADYCKFATAKLFYRPRDLHVIGQGYRVGKFPVVELTVTHGKRAESAKLTCLFSNHRFDPVLEAALVDGVSVGLNKVRSINFKATEEKRQ